MSNFTAAQTKQLLAGINPVRVLKDGKNNNHLPQQDVLAHLIRIFGFGAFDYEMLSLEPVFEQERTSPNGSATGKWDVCYRASMRLTIRNVDGDVVCRFEDGSTGDAQNQKRADGHDLAMKSAISLAKKRCAIALGDQFGLSLYNKGQMAPLVGKTMVMPGEDEVEKDVQADVPASVSMGHDEIDRPTNADEPDTQQQAAAQQQQQSGPKSAANRFDKSTQDRAALTVTDIEKMSDAATTIAELGAVWARVKELPEADRESTYAVLQQVKAKMQAEQQGSNQSGTAA